MYNSAVELLVALTLSSLYFQVIVDNPNFNQKPPLPAGYIKPESATHEWPNHEITYKTVDGLLLATYSAVPENPKGIIFIVPGYGDHSLGYPQMAKIFKAQGYAAYSIDFEGHGQSEGMRALIRDFNKSSEDVFNWMKMIKAKHQPGLKTFIWGNSMGGAVTLRLVLTHAEFFDGVILTSAAVKLADGLYPLLKQIVRYIAQYIPTVPIAAPVSTLSQLCSDEAIQTLVRSDPLAYTGRIRAQTGAQLLDTFDYIQNNLDKIKSPIMLFHGAKDMLTPLKDSSQLIYDSVKSTDKQIKIYENEFHVLHSAVMYKELAKAMIEWTNKHL